MLTLGQFWPELRRRIEQQRKLKAEWIAHGRAEDFTKYRESVAYIQALDWTLQEVSKINDDRPNREEEED